MNLEYDDLRGRPGLFFALTRLEVTEFERMLARIVPVYLSLHIQRLSRDDRQRALGAGHPFSLGIREQVLLTVIWLHLYPAWEVLGLLFGVSDTTAGRAISHVLPALEQGGYGVLRLPDGGRKQHLSLEELLRAVPELAELIDSPAPRVRELLPWREHRHSSRR